MKTHTKYDLEFDLEFDLEKFTQGQTFWNTN